MTELIDKIADQLKQEAYRKLRQSGFSFKTDDDIKSDIEARYEFASIIKVTKRHFESTNATLDGVQGSVVIRSCEKLLEEFDKWPSTVVIKERYE